ncbi:MAG: FAD-binding oxidoreductase [Thermoleophilia bacterium]
MLDTTFEGLQSSLRGRLVRPGDGDYDEVRALYNGMIDRRPAAIALCADVGDVVTAVDRARELRLPLAVRGAGHHGAGLGGVDDGLVIDLAALRRVEVDPRARTVRAGGGCTLADIDEATAPHGLAVPTGFVSSTGIGGLTLGGGTGYLTRQHGLTIDNLLEAEVVLADGRVVTASPASRADLFWALRGGGGNFGVVTSFLFRAHPVDEVFGGPVFWDVRDAGAMLRAYRDFLPRAPERLGLFAGLKTVPQAAPFPPEHQGATVGALIACHNGPEEEGIEAMRPLLDALPPPLFDWRGRQRFVDMQKLFDPLMPAGMQWYWRGDFVHELPDEAIEVHLEHARRLGPGSQCVMHLYPVDGAVHRVDPGATAWRAREARWSMVIAGIDSDPRRAAAVTEWARDYWRAVHPFSGPGGYVNFWMDEDLDDAAGRMKATYGLNLHRLRTVKATYDPGNLFRVNPNIAPASPSENGEG